MRASSQQTFTCSNSTIETLEKDEICSKLRIKTIERRQFTVLQITELTFTCLKSTRETLEKDEICSKFYCSIVDFEQKNVCQVCNSSFQFLCNYCVHILRNCKRTSYYSSEMTWWDKNFYLVFLSVKNPDKSLRTSGTNRFSQVFDWKKTPF